MKVHTKLVFVKLKKYQMFTRSNEIGHFARNELSVF
jgi:hypothetical protein